MDRWTRTLTAIFLATAGPLAQGQDRDGAAGGRPELDPAYLVYTQPLGDGLFFDQWYAYPLAGLDEPAPGLYTVIRDGKSGDFAGTLALDCVSRSARWQGGVLHGTQLVDEEFFATRMPAQVAGSVVARYCRK